MAKPNGHRIASKRKIAFDKLKITHDKRTILSLDGGGMRGILTIQLLKKLEETAGIPCFELFDMVAGTSTGGIIAGLIATGHTATDIEELYTELMQEVFDHRFAGNRFLNPPLYSKRKFRALLKKEVKNISMATACLATDTDLMITALDLTAAEETFFSCFKQHDDTYYGTYKDVLLRAAMEATMSAPTYFYPLERFVDGGATTYNNPALAAVIEAISYNTSDKNSSSSSYSIADIVLFSFGTGISRCFIRPARAVKPKGFDLRFWLSWLMTQTGQDASAMQVNAFRSPVIKNGIDFRRYQISLDSTAIHRLPDTDKLNEARYGSKWLHDLSNEVLSDIDMDDIKKFDLLKLIGEQMGVFIEESGNNFQQDLVDENGTDLLVSSAGDIIRIRKQMSSADWIDEFRA